MTHNIDNTHIESLKDRHLNLLLIEDSLVDAMMIKKLLSRHMPYICGVTHAETMASAEFTLKNSEIDIILLDLGLPDTNGGEDTFRRMANVKETIPVVILTSEEDHDLAMVLVDNGAEDFVSKTMIVKSPQQLCDTLDFAICRHDHMSDIKKHNASELNDKDMVIQWLSGGYSK